MQPATGSSLWLDVRLNHSNRSRHAKDICQGKVETIFCGDYLAGAPVIMSAHVQGSLGQPLDDPTLRPSYHSSNIRAQAKPLKSQWHSMSTSPTLLNGPRRAVFRFSWFCEILSLYALPCGGDQSNGQELLHHLHPHEAAEGLGETREPGTKFVTRSA